METRRLTILGATGSIGLSTLDVIRRHPERFSVYALTAGTRASELAALCREFQPEVAVMADQAAAKLLAELLSDLPDIRVLSGTEGLCEVASAPAADTVMASIVGAAGLPPTLSAVRSGKRVLLANKEALVMSGKLFMDAVADSGAELLPIDSEHNAIFQCLPSDRIRDPKGAGVARILLTASGGPFREHSAEALRSVSPAQACAHPNWSMGPKISVDSATMMNKGLEVIEAHWLFGVALDDIQVVVHLQSVIHSMVSYVDGSVLAQLGNPDMRTPIAHALAFPERIVSGVEPLDIFEVAKLEFEQPDFQRFPCLKLCYDAIRQGGSASIILNAANEVAVAAFLDNKIAYMDIANLIEQTLDNMTGEEDVATIENILAVDAQARNIVNECIARK